MNIEWIITEDDIKKLKNFIEINKDNEFVKKRNRRNTNAKPKLLSKNEILKALLIGLLTSQQMSGPNTKVANFLTKKPFPIDMNWIENNIENLEDAIKNVLNENELTRYINKISKFFEYNINFFIKNDWAIIQDVSKFGNVDKRVKEREYADYLGESLKGFGPKQSRNFLQALGATEFEIPIDSRITKWLDEFGFPLKLNSKNLSDKYYYHFINDGIIELCEKVDILPCVFDAIVFSSFDNNMWTKDNMAY